MTRVGGHDNLSAAVRACAGGQGCHKTNEPTKQLTEGGDLRENASRCPSICLAIPALTASLGAITDTLTFQSLLVM